MSSGVITALKNGDEAAFKQIYESNFSGLLRFANSYLHNESKAEDIVQNAFMSLWEKKASLFEQTNVKAFLVTVVKTKTLNYLEKEQNHLKIEQNLHELRLREIDLDVFTLESLNPEELFTSELESLLEKSIQSLPERTRTIFIMSRTEGLSNLSIANELNISVKGVEFHITKALKILRKDLGDYLPILIFFLSK
ncbi:MAG: RNA polymerase sigma-70 factor [Bacteroidota bacterium]|nr:RNA polymerase sigma-70 factor [Bacteroidota bacterium]MDP4204961.1 RNA polymerase sigma-70 factor [Bacteroidota bacterium]